MEIYLIRHGDCFKDTVDYYCRDKQTMNPPLTSKGIDQAHRLADRLKNIPFDKIYCSDLDRAKQTAEIIQTKLNTEIIISVNFREIDFGDIHKENKTWMDFPEIYRKWILHDEDIPYPNGENGADVWNRCKKEIDNIITLENKRIIIVCHGGTIRSIACGILNIPQHKRFFLGFPLENCSISIVQYKERNFYLHTFNDHFHITQ